MPPFRNNGSRGGQGRGGGGSGGRGNFGGSRRGGGGRGGGRGGYGGPKLPSTLLAEVDEANGSQKRRPPQTRKEQRKFTREEKRADKRPRPQAEQTEAEEDPHHDQAGPSRLPMRIPSASTKRSEIPGETPVPKKKKKRELTLPGTSSKAGDAEDGEIEWLEYMLRKEKGKGKEEDDLDDGLDDLLDFADIIGPGGSGLKQDMEEAESDDEDEMNGDDVDGEDEDDDMDEDDSDEEEGSIDLSEDDDEDIEDDEDQEVEAGSATGDGANDRPRATSKTGAARESETVIETAESAGTEPSRYIPPHLRAAALAEKSQENKAKSLNHVKLERKAQGLLNKLSEMNIESIVSGFEELYRENSRNDVSTTMTDLVINMISSKSNLLDSFVTLYASFVAALHRIIGVELGAHFLHTVVVKYISSASSSATRTENGETPDQGSIYQPADPSKESLNLLTLIAELYNVGVTGPGLIYDLIRRFVQRGLGEDEVEGLLKILKCCGSQLRHDDPGSLKDITNLVKESMKGRETNTRTRFMLETLTSLKPPKSEPNPSNLKKYLSSLAKKRRLLTTEPLRVSLNDLLESDTRGKWWLVGAGWAGNPLVEKRAEVKSIVRQEVGEEGLFQLAREQGMNTDVRRSVFVILMTSEDYLHAIDRMNALKCTEIQQRELVRVTLHCCNLEKTYNPYYTLILNGLCEGSYSHRFTLQYALWDLFRDMTGGGTNVGKAMAYLVARGTMDISVFKALDFTSLKKQLISFLRTFLTYLVVSTQTASPLFVLPSATPEFDPEPIQEVFERSLSNLELAQGLGYVFGRYMSKEKVAELGIGKREMEMVRKGVEVAKGVVGKAI